MVKFANSLEECLKEARPYKILNKNQSEEQKKLPKALIVFIPGWNAELTEYSGLLAGIISDLNQIDCISSWELLPFKYDNWFFSEADPEKVSQDLINDIQEYFNPKYGEPIDHKNYNRIILLGHSLGGLIARKAAFEISKSKETSLNHIFSKVNLILLASTNRGYSNDKLPFRQQTLDRIIFNPSYLIKKGKRGSDCINKIRLSWMRDFSDPEISENNSKPPAPPTIQLVGDKDRVVKEDDSLDIYRFSNTVEIPLKGINHSGFLFDKSQINKIIIDNVIEAFKRHFEENYSQEEDSSSQNKPSPPDCLVFLIHGIRDFADWHEVLEDKIYNQKPRGKVISIRYGYFTALQFILPLQRDKYVRMFIDRYIQEYAKNPNIPTYVAAHSFGTYIIANAMKKQSGIEIERAYFAGSVLPKNFDWHKVNDNNHDTCCIVRNDRANGDWAVGVLCWILRFFPWNNIGTAGVDGFANPPNNVKNSSRYIDGGHGAALNSPITEEIVNFLFHEIEDLPESKSTEEKKTLALVFIGLLFLLGVVVLLIPFILIILFSNTLSTATILSAIYTFIIIWILLSV